MSTLDSATLEELGQLIDQIDSLAHGLNLPLPAHMHVEQLKKILPEKVQTLKETYVKIAGENPWE